ncbi:5-amino-6-(D-ribitylamino)uracil--L-tyrosine 4-hydroxyphenyl transferase CofH [Methanonatronarchaeum sp. AMET6-2]|uniref:5-amino-6-(D-ribitylamino)uracil--L-tyrosine 4-hydroxyphenyl transferase CofH n=1 Tax=Methanonatronarchaeum sp. AMET6-2 TaxID=2933293 RepID=UPI001FF12318|nr:5-amino-6-(D-ribitylamino)uracil--L-tyrosine 4-hydroxyphenyl transferase CofH [Methanonatronarchaeum sp. AMET6-2]UOY10747.1 5-amino-6-(D-ribitylamino)uracil--L-tyrosine 4-hydroxyphenyl transferase CofH [Methanonatronarchaeum sp. AMET6-2]
MHKEARRLTREKHRGRVSYVKNRNINYTDTCIYNCHFCAYSRRPGDPEGYRLTKKQVLDKTKKAIENGATEICIQGGINPEIDYQWYLDLLETIKQHHQIHIHAFSPQEIDYMTSQNQKSTEKTLRELRKAGLDSMPGTAAEILDNRIRNRICPQKITSERWTEIILEAHRQGIPTTATMLYGHIETWRDRINHIQKLKTIQEKHGGFTEFIPLPFIPGNNRMKDRKKTTPEESHLVIAISRILLDGYIDNIQASWVKLGRQKAMEALNHGANDLGGTLMEENISSSTGQKLKTQMTPNQLKNTIKEAGKKPVERTTTYQKN